MSGRLEALIRRLVGRPDDGPGAVRLTQRRIYILPSRAGLLYAAMLLAMLLAAINYQLALGYALVFLLAGIALAGLLHTFRNLHGLQLACATPAPVFAGEMAHFPLTLDNRSGPPRPALQLTLAGQPPQMAAVDAEQCGTLSLAMPARRRGRLALPEIRLSTRFPLGLFEAWAYLRPACHCLVYPTPLHSPLPVGGGNGSQTPAGAPRRQGDDFAGFRVRQPADPLPHVAWKVSARQPDGALLIRQETASPPGRHCFDWADTDAGANVETRLGQLAGWVLSAEAAGLSYALQLPSLALPTGNGPRHCQRCLECLALATL